MGDSCVDTLRAWSRDGTLGRGQSTVASMAFTFPAPGLPTRCARGAVRGSLLALPPRQYPGQTPPRLCRVSAPPQPEELARPSQHTPSCTPHSAGFHKGRDHRRRGPGTIVPRRRSSAKTVPVETDMGLGGGVPTKKQQGHPLPAFRQLGQLTFCHPLGPDRGFEFRSVHNTPPASTQRRRASISAATTARGAKPSRLLPKIRSCAKGSHTFGAPNWGYAGRYRSTSDTASTLPRHTWNITAPDHSQPLGSRGNLPDVAHAAQLGGPAPSGGFKTRRPQLATHDGLQRLPRPRATVYSKPSTGSWCARFG